MKNMMIANDDGKRTRIGEKGGKERSRKDDDDVDIIHSILSPTINSLFFSGYTTHTLTNDCNSLFSSLLKGILDHECIFFLLRNYNHL